MDEKNKEHGKRRKDGYGKSEKRRCTGNKKTPVRKSKNPKQHMRQMVAALPEVRRRPMTFLEVLETYQWMEDERLDTETMRAHLLPALESEDTKRTFEALKLCENELKKDTATSRNKRRYDYLKKIKEDIEELTRT